MKLTRVQVRNFSSLFATGQQSGGDAIDLTLTDGMNSLVGPNNCGKSNLVNAIALALDPEVPFDYIRVVPAQMGRTVRPRVTLTFRTDGKQGPEKTLLNRAAAYERSVHDGQSTFADEHEIRFAVSFLADGRRQEVFLAKGAGARTGSAESAEYRDLYSQFRSVIRFVLVRSGESLESLLQGRFRDILHLVIRDHLSAQVEKANEARHTYMEALQRELLGPLSERIGAEVGGFFPEILETELVPDIPTVDMTLSQIAVRLRDSALTDLQGKGTGVRGTVLAAMLGYLAEQTRRSMVFAIEEPEAFLHPAAQEQLRGNLEVLAKRPDVTLLVTSHSPYVVSRAPESQIVELRKDAKGQTRLAGIAKGSQPAAERLGGLFRDTEVARILDAALMVPEDAEAILVVEGTTDAAYLQLAAERLGKPELIDYLHIVPAHGAKKVVSQALLLKAVTEKPVLILLDSDEIGRKARDRLKGIKEEWKESMISIRDVPGTCRSSAHELEAEDLWPSALLEQAAQELGEDIVSERYRCSDCGSPYRIGLSHLGKDLFPDWLAQHAKPEHCSELSELLAAIKIRSDRDRQRRVNALSYGRQAGN